MADFNIQYVIRAVDRFSPAIAKLQSDLAKTQTKSASFSKSMLSLSASTFSLSKRFLPLSVAIIGLGIYMEKTAANFEDLKISLESVTGSAENAAKIFNSIQKQTMAMPLSSEELTAATIKLRNYGVALQDIPKRLQQFSILSLGSKIDPSILIQSLGRSLIGLKTPLRTLTSISANLPIIEAIRHVTGLSQASFDALKKHNNLMISAATMQKAINYLTQQGSSFYDAALKRMNTVPAVLSEIHNSMRIYLNDISMAIFGENGMANVLIKIRDYLKNNEAVFAKFVEQHRVLVRYIAIFLGLLAAIAPILLVISGIVFLIGVVLDPIPLVILAIIAAITGLIIGVKYLYDHFVVLRVVVNSLLLPFKMIYAIVEGITGLIKEIISGVKSFVSIIPGGGVLNFKHTVQNKNVGVNSMQQQTINSNLGISVYDPTKMIKKITASGDSKFSFNRGSNLAYSI